MVQGGGAAFSKEAAGRAGVKLGNREESPQDHRVGAELREELEEWCSGHSGQIPRRTARQLELPLLYQALPSVW